MSCIALANRELSRWALAPVLGTNSAQPRLENAEASQWFTSFLPNLFVPLLLCSSAFQHSLFETRRNLETQRKEEQRKRLRRVARWFTSRTGASAMRLSPRALRFNQLVRGPKAAALPPHSKLWLAAAKALQLFLKVRVTRIDFRALAS